MQIKKQSQNHKNIYALIAAILKEKSPSCGCGEIYDGTFSKNLVPGDGVTAALLKENGIRVVGEKGIAEFLKESTTDEEL